MTTVLGCSRDPAERTTVAGLRAGPSRPGQSVILIVNDAMRRDRLGTYGGPVRTPALDVFARGGVRFDQACTQAPWTKPSIATLFTSLYPSQHGVLSHPRVRSRRDPNEAVEILRADILGEGFETLAEVMRAGSLKTAAFVGNPWMLREFGFGQGFDTYVDSFATWGIPGEAISRAALGWLSQVGPGERFFLYLHYLDSHRPYHRFAASELDDVTRAVSADGRSTPPRIRDEIARLILTDDQRPAAEAGFPASLALLEIAYDRGIEDFDRALGLFLKEFSAHPEYARTAIIVTSDHGEALYARGYGNHGNGLYEDETAIPLVARLPGVSAPGGRVAAPVGLVDLMPTLCSYAMVPCPSSVFGVDLLRPAAPGEDLYDRYLVTEGVMHKPDNRAIRHGPYKCLWQPLKGFDGTLNALFDIVSDSGESRNLLNQENIAGPSQRLLDDLLRGGRRAVPPFARPDSEEMPIDPELIQRLRALGYIQ